MACRNVRARRRKADHSSRPFLFVTVPSTNAAMRLTWDRHSPTGAKVTPSVCHHRADQVLPQPSCSSGNSYDHGEPLFSMCFNPIVKWSFWSKLSENFTQYDSFLHSRSHETQLQLSKIWTRTLSQICGTCSCATFGKIQYAVTI